MTIIDTNERQYVQKGKIRRLLRKGALCLAFTAAAVGGGVAGHMALTHTAPVQQPVATAPADPDSAAGTGAVFSYLAGPDHKLVSGQWTGYGSIDAEELQAIENMTGRRPGLVGADYLDFNGPRINVADVNAQMIRNWKQGSLVDIDVHFPNPWTGGGPQDRTVGNFAEVTTPGTPAYKSYMANLDKIADGLQQLQDAGVTVLFRPLMEMDGGWFWWGQQSGFPKLWQQTFDYLTETKGLHNLLWVYAADGRAPLDYYPGGQYVDVVGSDAYGYSGGKAKGYDALLSTGKPYALTELGLQSADYKNQSDPPRDLQKAVENIRRDMPAAVYFMTWSNAKGSGGNYWAIDAQKHAKAALNDADVQNAPVPLKPPAPPKK